MPVPVLTHEQRVAASAKAVSIRVRRAQIKIQLKTKAITFHQLLEVSEQDDIISGMKVKSVLESLPAVGPVKADALMKKCDIAPTRRIKGLGPHQLKALISELEKRQAKV